MTKELPVLVMLTDDDVLIFRTDDGTKQVDISIDSMCEGAGPMFALTLRAWVAEKRARSTIFVLEEADPIKSERFRTYKEICRDPQLR